MRKGRGSKSANGGAMKGNMKHAKIVNKVPAKKFPLPRGKTARVSPNR